MVSTFPRKVSLMALVLHQLYKIKASLYAIGAGLSTRVNEMGKTWDFSNNDGQKAMAASLCAFCRSHHFPKFVQNQTLTRFLMVCSTYSSPSDVTPSSQWCFCLKIPIVPGMSTCLKVVLRLTDIFNVVKVNF